MAAKLKNQRSKRVTMAKSNIYMLIDIESTQAAHAYDVAICLVNKGIVIHELSCIIEDFYQEPLFSGGFGYFSRQSLAKRTANYAKMLKDGSRILCSINHANRWIQKAILTYGDRLILTAYNLDFDAGIAQNSGIQLPENIRSFCLWNLSVKLFAHRESYIKFCFKNKHLTGKFNIVTNAEVMSDYLRGYHIREKHSAMEDLQLQEIPILLYCLRQKKGIKAKPYNWRDHTLHIALETLGVTL